MVIEAIGVAVQALSGDAEKTPLRKVNWQSGIFSGHKDCQTNFSKTSNWKCFRLQVRDSLGQGRWADAGTQLLPLPLPTAAQGKVPTAKAPHPQVAPSGSVGWIQARANRLPTPGIYNVVCLCKQACRSTHTYRKTLLQLPRMLWKRKGNGQTPQPNASFKGSSPDFLSCTVRFRGNRETG